MNGTSTNPFSAASKLGDLFASLPIDQQWSEITATAQSLANDLRVKNAEQQSALGKTLLPQTLTSLLKGATDGSLIPGAAQKEAIYELLRAAANLCLDHDENRNHLLEAGFPQRVVSLLEGYAEAVNPDQTEPLPLSIPDLKIVKTSIGVLLNASLGFEPVKTRLVSLEAALTILKLSLSIYPPGSWLRPSKAPMSGETVSHTAESWTLRTGLSQWAWRAISELRDDDDESSSGRLFTPDALPYIVRSLNSSIPPYSNPPSSLSPSLVQTLIDTDDEALQESCGLLESLTMDVEDIRLSLARGLTFPAEHGGVACLSEMLTFIEHGAPFYPLDSDRTSREKFFGQCKAAVVRAVVEVAGDEKNVDVLWDESDPNVPGGEFVGKLVSWIKTYKNIKEGGRDDLIICATISLGNIVRRDAHSSVVVHAPILIGTDLATLLSPDIDIKVKHGVVGLLKHLAVPKDNRTVLGEAGIMHKLGNSEIWSDKYDSVEMVQVAAIGVAKHLCNGDARNSINLVLPNPEQPLQASPLTQILALVRRSDSVAVKSEGTRVFVNAIKSIWSTDASCNTDPSWTQRRKAAMEQLVTPSIAAVLAQMVGRSKKYAILINEGVVAFSLLSMQPTGAVIVLDALMNPLPVEIPRSGPFSQPISAVPSSDSPAVGTPRRALDMLVAILRNADTPPEVRANICALVGYLGRPGVVNDSRARDVHVLKEEIRDVLDSVLRKERKETAPTPLAAAAKRALDGWGPRA